MQSLGEVSGSPPNSVVPACVRFGRRKPRYPINGVHALHGCVVLCECAQPFNTGVDGEGRGPTFDRFSHSRSQISGGDRPGLVLARNQRMR